MNARCRIAAWAAASALIFSCGKADLAWVSTDLRGPACREDFDPADPNETKFLVCPGAGGYSLRVRQVESGRESIDVVDPKNHVAPLSVEDRITRSMNSLPGKIEWRLAGGEPVGLLLRVEAREDLGDPEKITRVIWAVAKLGDGAPCFVAAEAEEQAARREADRAREKPCLEDLQP
jgi:hypothetical protein